MFHKILAANDGSENAFRALDMAAELAKSQGAELHVILVEEITPRSGTIEDVQQRKIQEDRLAAKHQRRIKAAAAHADVRICTHVFTGHPVRTIVSFAKDNAFDLLVIGAAGHSDFYEVLLGSRAGHIAHLSPCATFVVK